MKSSGSVIISIESEGKLIETKTASSVSDMWVKAKAIFAEHPEAVLNVTKDGEPFKLLHLVKKSNGKNWMVNDIKETNRKHTPSGGTKRTKTKSVQAKADTEAEPEIVFLEA